MIRIPDSEFQERVKKVQAAMAKEGFDMLLCYGNEAEPQFVRYFCDYWPSFETAGVLIPKSGEAKLLIGPESYTYAADRSRIADIKLLKAFRESSEPEYPGKPLDTFTSVFAECEGGDSIKRFGVAGLPLMTVGVYGALEEALKAYGDVKVEKADHIVSAIRMIKSENELACMRKAAEITHETMKYVLENIHVGMTETQVVGLALGKMHELGAERESYPLWVLTGAGSDQAISRPRHKVIQEGDLTFLQIGARYEGYASSIGRPVVFGKATEEQKNLSTKESHMTADNWYLKGQADWFFTAKNFFYLNAKYERDRIALLDYRFMPRVGYGYQWIERDNFNFSTEAGLTYTKEEYMDEEYIDDEDIDKLFVKLNLK